MFLTTFVVYAFKMKRIYYLYKLESPSGKVYIGQTTSLNKRFSDYRNSQNEKQRMISSAIKKYGWENIKKEIIFDGYKTQKEIDDLETFYIGIYTDKKVSLNICKKAGTPNFKSGSSHYRSNSVLKIDMNYNVIKEYSSGTEASLDIGVSQSCISFACRTERPFCAGFYWRFKNSIDIDNLKIITQKNNINTIEVVQMDMNNNLIKVWESQSKASYELDINQGNIYRVMSGKGSSAGGFKWAYKSDYEKNIVPDYQYQKRGNPVHVYDLKNNYIMSFESIAETSKTISVDRGTIMKGLKGKIKNPKKYIYKKSKI